MNDSIIFENMQVHAVIPVGGKQPLVAQATANRSSIQRAAVGCCTFRSADALKPLVAITEAERLQMLTDRIPPSSAFPQIDNVAAVCHATRSAITT